MVDGRNLLITILSFLLVIQGHGDLLILFADEGIVVMITMEWCSW